MALIYWIVIPLSLIVHFESLSAYCFYEPSNKEGYMQIWNLNHHSSKIHIFITYMISNIGNNDLNNGLTIYVNDKEKKQSYLEMLEFTNKHLQANENELNINLENNSKLIYKNNKLYIEAYSGEKDPIFEINIALPIDLNQSIKSIYEIKEKKISYEVVYFPTQLIKYKYQSYNDSSSGVFGLECLRSEENILNLANNIYFFRNYDAQYKFAAILFDSSKDLVQGNIHILNQTISLIEGKINNIDNTFDFNHNSCRIQTGILQEAGGFYVLLNVSKILQWFLKLIGINPYIKHYLSNLKLDCNEIQYTFPLVQFSRIHL